MCYANSLRSGEWYPVRIQEHSIFPPMGKKEDTGKKKPCLLREGVFPKALGYADIVALQ